MPRQGRICEPFDRISDSVTGCADPLSGSFEELTEIWESGPQSAQWQWYAYANGGAPNTIFGSSSLGAYVNTVSSAEDVNMRVGDENKSVIMNYPGRIYMKFASPVSQTSGSTRHIIGLKLISFEDNPEGASAPYLQINISCGTRNGATVDGIAVRDENFGLSAYTFFSIEAGLSYWVSVDFSPGASMAVRLWANTTTEPDDATFSIEDEDGYYILSQIDGIELFVNPIASAGKTYFKRFFVEGHCGLDDYLNEIEVNPAIRQQHHAAGSGGKISPVLPLPAVADNILIAWCAVRGDAIGTTPTGFAHVSGSPVGQGLIDSATPNAGKTAVYIKTAGGGEQAFQMNNAGGTDQITGGVIEVEGVEGLFSLRVLDNQASTNHPIITALTGSGVPGVVLAFFMPCEPAGATNTTHSPDGGFTEFWDVTVSGGALGPRGISTGKVDLTGASSFAPGTTNDNAAVSTKWAGIALMLS